MKKKKAWLVLTAHFYNQILNNKEIVFSSNFLQLHLFGNATENTTYKTEAVYLKRILRRCSRVQLQSQETGNWLLPKPFVFQQTVTRRISNDEKFS